MQPRGPSEQRREYFHSMSQDYGIIPRVEHYACMVDLLGHVGCLDEAENLIKEIPLEYGSMVWQTLLVACRVHGNMEMGKRVAENILEMEPKDPTTYGILSTIHTVAGRWEDVAKVQELMKDRGVKMEPRKSWIEIKSRVHIFVARYTSIRVVLSIATVMKWKVHQMDVKMTFLNGVIEEEVYVEQPQGFETHDRETHVCRLKKELYGLK
jgi:hypothetical protein